MAYADEKILLWLNGLVGESVVVDKAVSWVVSDYMIPSALALVLLGMWFAGKDQFNRQKYQITVFVSLASMALSSLCVFIINEVYFRPRPFVDHDVNLLFYEPTDPSFPSNSVAATFGIALGVWGVNKRLGTILIVVSSLLGLSRIYAGVHYPSDIAAGGVIAVIITSLVFKLRNLLDPIPTWVIKAGRIFCLT